MKRSEAIKMLQPYAIGITEVIKRENFESGIYQARAERLLDFIENELKMQPPEYLYDGKPGDVFNGDWVSEWEPEDEV